MLLTIKKRLGYIKRGLLGIIENNTDQPAATQKIASFQIGSTILGKLILCYKIGSGPQKILFVAGIHGNEIGSIKLAYRIINWLSTESHNYENFSCFVIPCLNPDGHEQALQKPDYWNGGLIGRFNGNNTDLNRNFDTPSFRSESVWSRGKNYSETTPVYCGPRPFSEPETRSLVDLIIKEQLSVYIALHNAGADVMGSNDKLGENLARIFSEASGYRFIKHEEWRDLQQTGTAKEWCDINKITYLEVEGRNRWSSDWLNNKNGFAAVLSKLLIQDVTL